MIIDFAVTSDSPIAGGSVRQLHLPQGAVLAMISRGRTLIPARGPTDIRPGDHLFVISRPDDRASVDVALRTPLDTPAGGE